MTSRTRYNNPDEEEALCLAYHYELLCDAKRIDPFKKCIQMVCPKRRVLESGTGSGVWSIWAVKSGAARVYSVEKDPVIAAFARKNIARSGFSDRIGMIQKDIREVTLADLDDEPVDVVIAENLSTWQVTEPQIPIMNHIHKSLIKKGGVVIPARIFNYLELAQSRFTFEEIVELRTHYFQFTGIQSPVILSDKILFSEIDLGSTNPTVVNKTVRAHLFQDGILNSIRLTSPLQLYGDIFFESSDSLMPPVVIPLKNDIHGKSGDQVEVTIQYAINSKWEDVKCHARIAG